MRTYDIIVNKTGTERHAVVANDPKAALRAYNEGDAHLKDDENDDVDSVTIVDRATGEEFDADYLGIEDGEPEPVVYLVRIRATARVNSEKTFEATSWEEAVAKAKALKPADFFYTYNREDGFDGDEIAYLGEADGDQEHEIDLRADGEPFSWEAAELVKHLAKIAISDDAAIAKLIARAKAACARDAGDAG